MNADSSRVERSSTAPTDRAEHASSAATKRATRAVLWGSCVVGLLIVGAIVAVDVESLTYFVSDDAYYYLLTAKNIALGKGSTFDGISPTNGYHPQWMLLLLPIYRLLANDPAAALKGVLILQLALNLASINLCFRWIARHVQVFGATVALLLLLAFHSPVVLMFNGMETVLLLFWLFLALEFDDHFDFLAPNATRSRRMLLGLVLAGVVSARLDSVFIFAALAGLKVAWPGARGSAGRWTTLVRSYAPTMLAFGLVMAPYFAWNLTQFGHLTPISGAIKATFPWPLNPSPFGVVSYPFVLPLLATGIGLVLILVWRRSALHREYVSRWNDNPRFMLFAAITLGCFMHLAWTRSCVYFGVYQWHFVAYIPSLVFAITLVLVALARRVAPSRWARNVGLAALAVLVVGYNVLLAQVKGDHHRSRIEAAHWVTANVPEGAGIALSDAGVFGYFDERPTMNLDGLINGYEFQEVVENGDLPAFLARAGIRYIADGYTRADREEHSVFVLAWRGKNRNHPIGYRFTGRLDDAYYRGRAVLYRPLIDGRRVCFTIWPIEKMKVERIVL